MWCGIQPFVGDGLEADGVTIITEHVRARHLSGLVRPLAASHCRLPSLRDLEFASSYPIISHTDTTPRTDATMTDENNTAPTSQRGSRRSSFAGQTFADLFGSGRSAPRNIPNNENQQYPGPITTAAAQAQRRRMSLTTVGLSGSSPNSTSPFNSFRGHRDSISSANSGSIDESAIEDDLAPKDASAPTTPFARRMSFGARAMRDIRNSSGGTGGGGGGGSPGQNNGRSPQPPTTTQHGRAPSYSAATAANNGTISARDTKGRGLSSLHTRQFSLPFTFKADSVGMNRRLTVHVPTGEGFNWSDNLRTRAERGSIAGPAGGGGVGQPLGANNHARAKSVATMEPPVQEMPRAPPQKPDHFQERILKGDFYMD